MRRPAPSSLVIGLVMAVNIAACLHWLWAPHQDRLHEAIVRSDVKGYYGYLQALFLRGDLGREQHVWEYVRQTPTGTLNKYYCGTAILMAPWFLAGHAFALADPDAPRDGLSAYEMKALSIGAWCHLLIGLLALRALLRRMGFEEAVAAWTLLAIGLGTQLLQYGAIQPGWSHIHSFCAISLFLLAAHRFAHDGPAWWLPAAAVLFALIILLRPVNALVALAVPVALGEQTLPAIRRAWRERAVLAIAGLAGAATLSMQPLLWHAQTGHWYAYGYAGEGFHWLRPEAFKVLFGFRRGLFLWAPVLLLALAGTAWLLAKERARGAWMLAYWTVNIYVISAWWIWYYGSGFGSRPFVDHYPALALPMAFALRGAGAWRRRAAHAFIAACCALQLFQWWQYNTGILHPESMDRAKYAYTFLRADRSLIGALGGNYQAPPFNPKGMRPVLEESCDFEHRCAHWSGNGIRHRDDAFSGGNAVVFDGSDEFGLQFEAGTDALPTGQALFLEVGLQRREENPRDAQGLLGVTEVKRRDGSVAYYEPFAYSPLPARPGIWEQVEYRIPVPALEEGDALRFYFWDQRRRSRVLIDDVFMRVNAVNPY